MSRSRAAAPPPPYTLLEAALGSGLSRELMEQALTHRSYAYEHGGLPTNERLEFLGDAVLGLVVTESLYAAHPGLPEGSLAKLRASVVNTRALAGVARGLGLGRWLRLGRGEETTGGRDKNSLLADTMEALIGAVYLERGLPGAQRLVRGGAGAPEYALTESGPDHDKRFEARVLVGGDVLGTGAGLSKKEAEQHAAEAAARALAEAGRAGDPDAAAASPP